MGSATSSCPSTTSWRITNSWTPLAPTCCSPWIIKFSVSPSVALSSPSRYGTHLTLLFYNSQHTKHSEEKGFGVMFTRELGQNGEFICPYTLRYNNKSYTALLLKILWLPCCKNISWATFLHRESHCHLTCPLSPSFFPIPSLLDSPFLTRKFL